MKKVNPVPYVGTEKLYIYPVTTDDSSAYTGDTENMLELEGGMVSSSFDLAASVSSFYADNAVQISDSAFTPTASIGYAGDNADIDKILYGKKNQGGAMLDNLGASPEIGCFFALNLGKGKWIVRQILRATATKDATDITTKGETTTFTNPTATLAPLLSNHFNSYTRDFYSDDAALTGKTLEDVIGELVKNPGATFPTSEV